VTKLSDLKVGTEVRFTVSAVGDQNVITAIISGK
jgi:hypothetical protein